MSRKLDKIGEDLEKTRARYEEYGRRIQELEAQYAEQEKSEISDIVHAANLTPDQLQRLLAKMAADPIPQGAIPEDVMEGKQDED
ncbi:MAG: DUF4315 family protein [Eubacterium sp.]|nr:DUF4315 family protein [Eubacterium sp.]